jgi:hypothetical protein
VELIEKAPTFKISGEIDIWTFRNGIQQCMALSEFRLAIERASHVLAVHDGRSTNIVPIHVKSGCHKGT